MPRNALRLLLALACLAPHAAAVEPPLEDAGLDAGLAVHVSATADGALEKRLAATGRWLVLSLTLDDGTAERLDAAVAEAGLSGLVTMARWQRDTRLPLADRMANLIVADADALGRTSPSEAELKRALVPVRGKALIHRGGEWTTLETPMPGAFDEWTHFFHGPDGNALSRDTAVRVPNALRWIGGPRQHDSHGANGWRVCGGVAVSEWNYPLEVKRVDDAVAVEARDAFNGTLFWQRVVRGGSPSKKTRPLILADGRLLRLDDRDEAWKLAAWDPLTGKLLRRYEHSFVLRSSQWGRPRTAPFGAVYHHGAIYQTLGRALRRLDAETGEVRWEYTAPETHGHLYRPTVAADLGLIVLVEGPGGETAKTLRWKGLFGGRYPSPIVNHVLA
ncbi:MAG: hypothetical protein ACODAJ_10545, partial [Planctomycetota bacterium]